MLDESQYIQNEKTKCYKFISKLDISNCILLSGTPTGGKYEKLWTQCRLLGWNITKTEFWKRYIEFRLWEPAPFVPPIKIVTGYKNVEDLKANLRKRGADFLKTEDVLTLPEQVFTDVYCDSNKSYDKFCEDNLVAVEDKQLIGDTTLTRLLYRRQLCGIYSNEKMKKFSDLIESTDNRIVVFYNFTEELERLKKVIGDRPYSIINGHVKDLSAYEKYENAIIFVQYQAGSMGLNLQLANCIIYYTLPLSSMHFEQSKKRIHRIGQKDTCFYYTLICKGSVEEKIFETLKKRKDYTEKLFELEQSKGV
jgi:SNF2 family DNA or RNA helicase